MNVSCISKQRGRSAIQNPWYCNIISISNFRNSVSRTGWVCVPPTLYITHLLSQIASLPVITAKENQLQAAEFTADLDSHISLSITKILNLLFVKNKKKITFQEQVVTLTHRLLENPKCGTYHRPSKHLWEESRCGSLSWIQVWVVCLAKECVLFHKSVIRTCHAAWYLKPTIIYLFVGLFPYLIFKPFKIQERK